MEKLIDNKLRDGSFCYDTDLLYRKENVYLMDNHRTAAWCWANHFQENEKYTIVHIDKHYDTVGNEMNEWIKPIKNGIKNLSINEYDNLEYQKNNFEKFKVFKWDNYIPLFHHYHSNQILEYFFYTHNRGDIPENLKKHINHCPAYNLINDFFEVFSESENNLIINLDIDYFFCNNPNYYILFSENAIERLIDGIMNLVIDKQNLLTIALSPECCGGWENSMKFIRKYFSKYGIYMD